MGAKAGNPKWVRGGPSPNPGGRPKGSRDASQASYGADADKHIDVADSILFNPKAKDADKLAALKIVIEQGWGRPHQQVELSDAADRPRIVVLSGVPRNKGLGETESPEALEWLKKS